LTAALALGLFTVVPVPGAVGALPSVDIRIETTLPISQPNRPALALDGKRDTFFRSNRGADEKDQFTVYFSRALELQHIDVLTGDENGTNGLAAGALEVSADGKEFKEAAKFESGIAKADLNKQPVHALRIRPAKREQPQQAQAQDTQSQQAQAGTAQQDRPRRGQFRREGSRLVIREIALDPPPTVQSVTQAMCIVADTSAAPELDAWGRHAKALCDQWYFRIVDLLPSESFEPTLATRLLFIKDMSGVANTSRETDIRISADFVKRHTNDWGMVIHELAHVVQRYPGAKPGFTKPGWLVEGIADYIRLVHFEPQARRPRINPDKAKYTDAYKTTAGFLEWVEKQYDKALVKKFGAALRQGEFEDGLWKKHTGRTVDELWKEFTDTLRKKESEAADSGKQGKSL
jgi:hypothetical protein